MKKAKHSFKVFKKKLKNGLTVLFRPSHVIPSVSVQLWYNVGSKNENSDERGMAHLVEHMLFKGTKKLSESDINIITNMLSGYANAFTSNDYTSYVFKLPSNVWEQGLMILADCMRNARFDTEMFTSELHAVIQEMKLYKDDYQGVLIEKMLEGIFPGHPYHNPIIGYNHDLLHMNRDALYAFYKKYYQPSNATLVVVGDVKRDDVFAKTEKYFGKIASSKQCDNKELFFVPDVYNSIIRLPREVENSWVFYAYIIPGFESKKLHIFNMIEFLLCNARSSRLYEKLVNQTKLATSVGCFSYDLFEKGLFIIYVQPKNQISISRIETIINEELKKVATQVVEDWEFTGAKKKAQLDYYALLEDIERQAELIGSAYLATGDANYLNTYLVDIVKTKRLEIKKNIATYLQSSLVHKGYLIPAGNNEKKLLQQYQDHSDSLDQKVLKKQVRKTEVEKPRFAAKIKSKPLPEFSYPIPKSFVLDNGLEVIYHHNLNVPKISLLLGFKANYLYEPQELGGISTFLSKLLLEGTKSRSAQELNKYLEIHGISISTSSGLISLELAQEDLSKGLEILCDIVTNSACKVSAIEKVRQQTLAELQEYWDTPSLFVDTLARETVYKGHPYAKNSLGYKECVNLFSRDQVIDFYKEYMTPQETTLVIVGDLQGYTDATLQKLLERYFGCWRGKQVSTLLLPEISYVKPKVINYVINRDQVVLAFVAPSVSRLDENYDAFALLDVILTGGGTSAVSRLFQLREQTGLFYTIGGSLVYGADKAPGMMYIKTVVSMDKVEKAEKLIKKTIKNLRESGVKEYELYDASRALMSASTGLFEDNMRIAQVFLFLKRCGLTLDLFDKRSAFLSILNIGIVNTVARRYCKENNFSTIKIGRSVRLRV